MKTLKIKLLIFQALFIVCVSSGIKAQLVDSANKVNTIKESENETKNKLQKLQNDFIRKIRAMGYHPRLKAPQIILDNPPSYGNYDDSLNVLHIGFWKTLPVEDKGTFDRIAKGIGNGFTGETYFNYSVHQWVFIHEMGHWWRACQHEIAEPYASEMAADRIDIAYWRTADTVFSNFMNKRFANYLKIIPSPVPAGANAEQFLNNNYGKLPVPAYIWYQSKMIEDGYDEKPIPSFKQSIASSGNLSKTGRN